MSNPYLPGSKLSVLVSSSKDGFLKFWDIDQQLCLLNFSDDLLTKISDFVLLPELKVIILGLGSEQKHLSLYQLRISPATYKLEVKPAQKLKKETSSKVIELHFANNMLTCMSAAEKGHGS